MTLRPIPLVRGDHVVDDTGRAIAAIYYGTEEDMARVRDEWEALNELRKNTDC